MKSLAVIILVNIITVLLALLPPTQAYGIHESCCLFSLPFSYPQLSPGNFFREYTPNANSRDIDEGTDSKIPVFLYDGIEAAFVRAAEGRRRFDPLRLSVQPRAKEESIIFKPFFNENINFEKLHCTIFTHSLYLEKEKEKKKILLTN